MPPSLRLAAAAGAACTGMPIFIYFWGAQDSTLDFLEFEDGICFL